MIIQMSIHSFVLTYLLLFKRKYNEEDTHTHYEEMFPKYYMSSGICYKLKYLTTLLCAVRLQRINTCP